MRARIACLFVVALIFATVPGNAQQEPGLLLEDPAGDVVYLLAEETELGGGTHGPADLTLFRLKESEDTFHFTIQVADLGETLPGTTADAARLDVRFRHGDIRYDVGTGIYQDGRPFAEVRRAMPGGIEQPFADVEFDFEPAGVFTVHVPRELLTDEAGTPPQPGQAFEDLHVDSHVHATGIFFFDAEGNRIQPLGIRDRLPDSGEVAYDVLLGGPDIDGPMDLRIPEPYRASNGGEAALFYPFTVTNLDDTEATFVVAIRGAPSDWTIEAPQLLIVGAGASRDAGLLVRTPFGHQHGGQQSVDFVVARDDGAAMARAEIGILYLEVPQPAGHHDTLWLHPYGTQEAPVGTILDAYGFGNGRLSMNADPEAESQDMPVTGFAARELEGIVAPTKWHWAVCLQPELRLGLDFDLGRTGTFTARFSGERLGDAVLSGELRLLEPGPPLAGCSVAETSGRAGETLANVQATAPQATQGGATFEATVDPTAAGDYVPYAPGSQLVLQLQLEYSIPFPTAAPSPAIEPGAVLQLPLDEFYDEGPAGLVGGDGSAREHLGSLVEPDTTDEVEDAPMPAMAVLVALAAIAVMRRR